MMKKIFILMAAMAAVALCFLLLKDERGVKSKIALILPVEHQALTEMMEGFTEELKSLEQDLEVIVQNAQGDPNLMKAMMNQAQRQSYKIIVTVGSEATLMAQNTIKDIPLIGLDVTAAVQQNQDNLTGTRESSVEESFNILKLIKPTLKKVTVIHSASEKAVQQMKTLQDYAHQQGITVQLLMVQTMPELYTMRKQIAPDSEVLFIVKDHLVVSAVPTLLESAEELKIPLISCDEGSVKKGVALAFGVSESDIGRKGAQLAQKILKEGVSPKTLEMIPMPAQTVFVNRSSAQNQGLSVETLQKDLQARGMRVIFVEEKHR